MKKHQFHELQIFFVVFPLQGHEDWGFLDWFAGDLGQTAWTESTLQHVAGWRLVVRRLLPAEVGFLWTDDVTLCPLQTLDGDWRKPWNGIHSSSSTILQIIQHKMGYALCREWLHLQLVLLFWCGKCPCSHAWLLHQFWCRLWAIQLASGKALLSFSECSQPWSCSLAWCIFLWSCVYKLCTKYLLSTIGCKNVVLLCREVFMDFVGFSARLIWRRWIGV